MPLASGRVFLLHNNPCIKHFLSKDRMQQATMDWMQQIQRFFMSMVAGASQAPRRAESDDNVLGGLVLSKPGPRGSYASPSHLDALRSRFAALPPPPGHDGSPSPGAFGLPPPPRHGGALSPGAPRLSPPSGLDDAIIQRVANAAGALAMIANKAAAKSRPKVAVAADDSIEKPGDARKGSKKKKLKKRKKEGNEGHHHGEASNGNGGQGTTGHDNGVGAEKRRRRRIWGKMSVGKERRGRMRPRATMRLWARQQMRRRRIGGKMCAGTARRRRRRLRATM